MDTVLSFLNEWWPLVVLVAAGLAKVLNMVTPHFASRAGIVKALLIVVDLLDLIKFSRPPSGKSAVLVLIVAGLAVSACAPTLPDVLATADTALRKQVSPVVEPVLKAECIRRAETCKAQNIPAVQCTPMLRCREWIAIYVVTTKTLHEQFALLNRLWHDLKQEGLVK